MRAAEYELFREVKKHTNIQFPYHTYLCMIPSDFQAVPIHWRNETAIVVVKKGSGIMRVGMEARTISAGELVVVAPGQLHAIRRNGDATMEYELILFQMNMLVSSPGELCMEDFLIPFQNGETGFPVWIDGSEEYHAVLKKYIEEIDSLTSRQPMAYQMGIRGYLCQFFAQLFEHSKRCRHHKSEKIAADRLKIILNKIEASYSSNLPVQEMADLVGVSQPHFMKFFKQNVGIPFVQYLNEYRLMMAGWLLISSKEEVLTVAIASGFDNISYFNRSFKKWYGVTPGDYRKQKQVTIHSSNIPRSVLL